MLTPPMLTGKIKILQHCYGQNRHPAILTDMCIYTAAGPQLWGHESCLVGFVCFKSLSSLWSGDDKLFREPLLSSLNERNERWPPVTVSKKKIPLNWNATIAAVVCYNIVILVIWESQTVNTVCRYSLEKGLRGDVLVHWYTARSLTHILYWPQDKQEIMMFLSLGKMSWADCVTMALARLAWVKVIFVGDLLFFHQSPSSAVFLPFCQCLQCGNKTTPYCVSLFEWRPCKRLTQGTKWPLIAPHKAYWLTHTPINTLSVTHRAQWEVPAKRAVIVRMRAPVFSQEIYSSPKQPAPFPP